ncbi:3-methyladenine DNA glycosylase [Jeotgalibacillus proteolyticus]|uniref:3-methyladenine DNA glycosylase n=1 Tax=Jeotgalibacillus proteolyticus TaxID=2082395 RepID=A0A2S5G7H9_9BACL|nr:3-methyladenine DNA glycosylase [Jeotgalibacillus proteolyticus]PPA68939.1 3-methyladenine DNA glycosylase [Jeotgalibacillus proteolyticus]
MAKDEKDQKKKENDSIEQQKKKEEGQDIDPQRDSDKPKHSDS